MLICVFFFFNSKSCIILTVTWHTKLGRDRKQQQQLPALQQQQQQQQQQQGISSKTTTIRAVFIELKLHGSYTGLGVSASYLAQMPSLPVVLLHWTGRF